jgi:hypothetical protein
LLEVADMSFTPTQVEQLLKPINQRRVLRDGKGHSHVSQQDVTAHLIRMLGFGGFDVDVSGPHLVFESERLKPTGEPTGRWDVCYRAMCRLTVKDPHGQEIAHYEDGSTATAQNQTRGDAHDLAYKSAISLSKKRAAINLGDQFGLSLYNKGQLEALVMGTLVKPEGEADAGQDIQHGVSQQVSLGNDEVDHEPAFAEHAPAGEGGIADPVWVERMTDRIGNAPSRSALTGLAREISDARQDGACDQATADRLWQLGTERQALIDSVPRNRDGSPSRSQASDEQLSAVGAMTKEQQAEHNRLAREAQANPRLADRVTGPAADDPWATGGAQ